MFEGFGEFEEFEEFGEFQKFQGSLRGGTTKQKGLESFRSYCEEERLCNNGLKPACRKEGREEVGALIFFCFKVKSGDDVSCQPRQ